MFEEVVADKDIFVSLPTGFGNSLRYILLPGEKHLSHKNSIRNDLRARLGAALIAFLTITANL